MHNQHVVHYYFHQALVNKLLCAALKLAGCEYEARLAASYSIWYLASGFAELAKMGSK